MKTFIIATMLSVGVLLQQEMALTGNNGQIDHAGTEVTIASTSHASSRILQNGELESIQGTGILECYAWTDANQDDHAMCCLNLWLFRVCFDVNVSEIGRVISALI